MPTFSERVAGAIDALLGRSAYQRPAYKWPGGELDSDTVKQIRAAMGGQLQPLVTTRLRWYLHDLERAQRQADLGLLTESAQLWRAMKRDGVISGLARSRASGLVRLPKRYYGDGEICDSLRGKTSSRAVFDEMFPPQELKAMDADGFALGVAIGELVPVPGRDYPVLVRLDPEFLQYIWVENRWYFISLAGRLPITPGDGRWILHTPGPRMSPWQFGLWPALGRSFINKEHAMSYRSNYAAKLANPARVAQSPLGATEVERNGMLARLISWGLNSVFELPPGWEAKILETNGRGWEVFQRQIDTSDYEIMIALAGQIVTTEGGTGFSNIEAPEKIRADLIEDDGDALAYTIATQGLPQYVAGIWGEDAVIERNVYVDWATEKPKDRDREAEIMAKVATGIRELGVSLAPYNRRLNVTEITTRFQIPIEGDPDAVAPPGPNDEPAPDSTPALEPPADGGASPESKPGNDGLRDGQDVDEPEDDDKAAQ